MIKSINDLDPNGYYTYGDYLLWKIVRAFMLRHREPWAFNSEFQS